MIGPSVEWTNRARHSKQHKDDIIECFNANDILIALGALNVAVYALLRVGKHEFMKSSLLFYSVQII